MKTILPTLILLLTLAIAGVVGFIVMDSRSQEEVSIPEPTTTTTTTTTTEPHDLNFLNSLSSFTSREIPTQTITVYKQAPTLSLSFLYSPFTNHIGFASSISYSFLNAGFTYTENDFYFSLGLTLTF